MWKLKAMVAQAENMPTDPLELEAWLTENGMPYPDKPPSYFWTPRLRTTWSVSFWSSQPTQCTLSLGSFGCLPRDVFSCWVEGFNDPLALCVLAQLNHLWYQVIEKVDARWLKFRKFVRNEGPACSYFWENGRKSHRLMYLHANTTTIRRALGLKLKTELSKIQKNLPLGCISCTAPNTITTWKAWIHGPPETPYAGGKFLVLLTFLESFPYNPPRVSWKTKIFHPQIEQDGKVCHELLHWDWNPSFNVSSILLALFFLLVTPSSEESVVRPVGRMLKEQPEQFMKVCREWTEKYAQEGPEVEEGFWERGDKEDDPEDNGS